MVEDMYYVSVKFLFGDGKRKRTQFVQVLWGDFLKGRFKRGKTNEKVRIILLISVPQHQTILSSSQWDTY